MYEDPNGINNEQVDENLRDNAPLSMGYKSGFNDNLATEDAVTITTGLFKKGTAFQVSKLRLNLGKWYGNARNHRDELMFSHERSPNDTHCQTSDESHRPAVPWMTSVTLSLISRRILLDAPSLISSPHLTPGEPMGPDVLHTEDEPCLDALEKGDQWLCWVSRMGP